MKLTQRELDRVLIFSVAEMARRRKARGLKLNYPESVALICDEVLEEARAGRSYAEVIAHGRNILTKDDVLDGVTDLLAVVQVEADFADGTKLVTIRQPIAEPQGHR